MAVTGEVAARSELRYTPAGLERIEIKLAHQSVQQQAGNPRQVRFELNALALGEVARQALGLTPGDRVKLEGFLAPRSLNSSQLVLQIDNITLE